MRTVLALAVLAIAVVAVLAYAWVDGGRQPVRIISEPLAVPGEVR